MKNNFTFRRTVIFILVSAFSYIGNAANLVINFTGMNPHIGQQFYLRIIDKASGAELDRTNIVASASFTLSYANLVAGQNYWIDFWADLNGNGKYDAPSTDHAWRLSLDNETQDDTINFTHNTNFTDIKWPYLLKINFESMNPHVGQLFELRVINKSDGSEVGRVKLDTVPGPTFTLSVPGIQIGGSYMIDFWADLNGNKKYDAPGTDHAWRLNLDNVAGDTTLTFSHNTSFTDIKWPYQLKVDFSSMNPHVGQLFELRVVNKADNSEVGRVKISSVLQPDFIVTVPGLQIGNNYRVDFWADLNGNKKYDAPGTDHAWRLSLDHVAGDTTLSFTHNTTFTDIKWPYELTVDLENMNPHIGQLFELRVVNKSNGFEVGRVKINSVLEPNFSVSVPGIEIGGSYMVDFYADLNGDKKYDAPPVDHAWRMNLDGVLGDTTLTFSHNVTFTDVKFPYILTVNFEGMNPHIGQLFELRVVNKADGSGIGRVKINSVSQANFSVSIPGIQIGKNYMIDFYADLNVNKKYDAPPVDHAWRLNLDNVTGDTTLTFTHSVTNFTDVKFPYLLTVDFVGMNPHLGQLFELRVVDKADGIEIGRNKVTSVLVPDFSVSVSGIQLGHSYMVDFYADLNGNKKYDSPPADHAWRMILDNVAGDTTLTFTHNTTFTDVKFPYILRVDFFGMNPHIGQFFELRVVSKADGSEIGRTKMASVPQASFSVSIPGIQLGASYRVDFWADLNGNKKYDVPSTDHAWRLNLDNVAGDTTMTFTHNTTFTDIKWPYELTVDFLSMNPHVGQLFELRVVNKADSSEVGRVKIPGVPQPDFTVSVPGIQIGNSYMVDFWADLNGNKKYDPPSADHAWRLNLDNVTGDTTLTFTHNTTFTDVKWSYLLTIQFMAMNPHIGQLFDLHVFDKADNSDIGKFHLDSIIMPDFTALIPGIMSGASYRIDFWADLNKNGVYDAPPADHAWRLELDNVVTDTTLVFTHNTNFTDIFPPTSLALSIVPNIFKIYPNPSTGLIDLRTTENNTVISNVLLFDLSGKLLNEIRLNASYGTIDYSSFAKGIYFIQVQTNSGINTQKLILK